MPLRFRRSIRIPSGLSDLMLVWLSACVVSVNSTVPAVPSAAVWP
jgi:hypothetical protein